MRPGQASAWFLGTAVAILAFPAALSAQGESPRGKAEAVLGGKAVVVEYGRPALEGRNLSEVMSGLPADRMWRAGMNPGTTLKTDADLLLGAHMVPAGEYSVYVHVPQAGNWSLVLNSVLGEPPVNGGDRAPDEVQGEPRPRFLYTRDIGDKEVARAIMRPAQAYSPAEVFTIDLVGHFSAGVIMTMSWGDQAWSVALKAAK